MKTKKFQLNHHTLFILFIEKQKPILDEKSNSNGNFKEQTSSSSSIKQVRREASNKELNVVNKEFNENTNDQNQKTKNFKSIYYYLKHFKNKNRTNSLSRTSDELKRDTDSSRVNQNPFLQYLQQNPVHVPLENDQKQINSIQVSNERREPTITNVGSNLVRLYLDQKKSNQEMTSNGHDSTNTQIFNLDDAENDEKQTSTSNLVMTSRKSQLKY